MAADEFNDTCEDLTSSEPELSWTDLVYGTVFRPRDTFRRAALQTPVFKSFIIFSAVVILNLVAALVLAPHSVLKGGMPVAILEVMEGAFPFFAVIGTVFAYLNWILLAAIFHLFAEFFEGKGSALGMLTVLGLIEIPRVVLLPFQVVGTVAGSGFVSTFFTLTGSLFYLIWWSVLLVVGIREAYALNTGKALAVISAPFFFLILSLVIVTIAGVGLLVPLLNMLSPGS